MADHRPRILAVVPARGGSKRLPRKNVRPLAGRPLIDWSIRAALDSGVCVEVLVSTDDVEIGDIARQSGALVPWLRPAELSHDTVGTAPVLTHALAWYEQQHGAVDAVLLLQPTSPFRTAASVRVACATFASQPSEPQYPVVSVSPVVNHPAWTFYLNDDVMEPCLGWDSLSIRSQDLPPAYGLNGALYVIPAADVRKGLPIVRPGVIAHLMPDPVEGLDIDTPADWNEAERLAARLKA
jgi:CMP-N,N'-diacetyllegionaminic acid synthase